MAKGATMKKLISTSAITICFLAACMVGNSLAADRTKSKFAYMASEILAEAETENAQIEALNYIITHSDSIDQREVVFLVMRLYKTGKSIYVQQLSITALQKMNNRIAIRFLQNEYDTTDNPILKDFIWVALQKQETKKG